MLHQQQFGIEPETLVASCNDTVTGLPAAKMNGYLKRASLKEQLLDASKTTARAYVVVQTKVAERGEDAAVLVPDSSEKTSKDEEDKKMSPKVAMMQPILRFLQLLCENHNQDLQVTIVTGPQPRHAGNRSNRTSTMTCR